MGILLIICVIFILGIFFEKTDREKSEVENLPPFELPPYSMEQVDHQGQAKPTYTEDEVKILLETQRGNCYVAVLTATMDEEIAKVAGGAPEPGQWKKLK
jgi:hypothetical protein